MSIEILVNILLVLGVAFALYWAILLILISLQEEDRNTMWTQRLIAFVLLTTPGIVAVF